jgi:hypothetical protein
MKGGTWTEVFENRVLEKIFGQKGDGRVEKTA